MTYTPRREAAPSTNTERRPAVLLALDSRSATARFRDGSTYSLPAQLFAKHEVQPGEPFTLIRQYAGKRLLNVRVEPVAPAANIKRKVMPKVQVRSINGRLTTRKT